MSAENLVINDDDEEQGESQDETDCNKDRIIYAKKPASSTMSRDPDSTSANARNQVSEMNLIANESD